MKNGKFSRRGVATKTLVLVLTVMMIVGISVGGTLAWLTAQSGTVTNTFTAGDINISLTETVENSFKIVPGGTAVKDPTLTVAAKSENCYVYVCVENNVKIGDAVVATPNIDTAKWIQVGVNGNKTVYRYHEIVEYSEAKQDLSVFTQVKYSETITKDNIDDLANTTIKISGFAHQSDNTTVETANAAATAEFFKAA